MKKDCVWPLEIVAFMNKNFQKLMMLSLLKSKGIYRDIYKRKKERKTRKKRKKEKEKNEH